MSRGPGRWQRALLAAVDEYKLVPTVEFTWVTLQRKPTRSELVAVRRAAKSIVMAGGATAFYACQCRGCHKVYGNWPSCCPSVGSGAVLVLTSDEAIMASVPTVRIPSWVTVAPARYGSGATITAGGATGILVGVDHPEVTA